MDRKKIYAVVAVSVVGASFSPILIKTILLRGVDPDVAAFYRMLVTVLMLAPFVLFHKGHRRAIAALSPREKGITLLSGTFLSLHFISWFFAVKYTSILSSAVLVNMSPVFLLAVESLHAKKWPRATEAAGVLIALSGLVILNLPHAGEAAGTIYGNLLAILAAVFLAGYLLCSRSVRPKLQVLPYSFLVYGICTLGIFLWVLAAGRPLAGYTWTDFALFGAMAIVCTLLGHTLFQWALRYIRASALSVWLLGEPVGSAILAFFLFREVLGPLSYIGGVILLGGIALFSIKGKGAEEAAA